MNHAAPLAQQLSGDPVILGNWPLDEDAPVHPGGMKPKRVFVCPQDVRQPYLIRGHRYLFKEAEGFRVQQLWSEVIAYELTRAIGTPVPPAFVAFDEKRGKAGVLIEFFFGRPDHEPRERFIHAIERMQGVDLSVDLRRGSLRDNLTLCALHSIPKARRWWAETIAFDTVIGNTDRHTENWGFLRQTTDPREGEYRLAPVFDNGTSLGFQIRDDDLARFGQRQNLDRFIARGGHHYGWFPGEPPQAPHAALCARMITAYPSVKPTMDRVARLPHSHIDDTLQWCTRFNLDVRFTADRAAFVRKLLTSRLAALAVAIGI